MQQPLIFTERRLLPRLIDILLTLAAWVGFLWLIYHGMVKPIIAHPDMGPHPVVSTLNTLALYLLIAVLYGGALIIWARYNQYRFRHERRTRRSGLESEELAESFAITPELVAELNKARVLTVHHNENGSIKSVVIHHINTQTPA